MKKIFFFVFLFLGYSTFLEAQYTANQNKIWTFGSGVKVDFTSGTPVAGSCSISTGEGCASVCDASGAMLFYTDGYYVYDRTGTVMTSAASGIAPASWGISSTTQGSFDHEF